jgi:hypothetical protein
MVGVPAHYVVVSHVLPSCGGRLLGGAPAAVWSLLALYVCVMETYDHGIIGDKYQWWCMVGNHAGQLQIGTTKMAEFLVLIKEPLRQLWQTSVTDVSV